MRARALRLSALFAIALAVSRSAGAQSGQAPPEAQARLNEIVDRMNRSENGVIVRMRMYHPLVEVYIQNLALDEQLGWVPTEDDYFLGQFHIGDSPQLKQLTQSKKTRSFASRLPGGSGTQYLPDGFAAMAAPDWRMLERSRYAFTFVRREFLGEARCFVLDVKPIREGKDGFSGRIWIDDRDYTIVRFNGISRGTDQTLSSFFRRTLSFHVDGWRVNVMPGVWLPSYLYLEETDLNGARAAANRPRFKSQVRIWGYEAQSAERTQQLATILIDEPAVTDTTDLPGQLSPVLSQRRWEQEAEANVIDRLEKIGLLAPPGEVDQILETVLNNLVVSSHLTLERPLHCRVLLTSPLESFTVGHTIVLSRGLIDVLPDEASLAMMLAHELGHVVLGHPLIDTKFSFADRLMVGDAELLRTLQFRHTAREEAAADDKVIDLLRQSPYSDKLANAGLFLRVVSERAKLLHMLILSHIGDRIAEGGQLVRMADVMRQAPALAPGSLEQIAALPLGARLVVEPWSGRLVLDRSPAVPLASIREKVPLAVTPLMPYIRYAEPAAETPKDRQASR